MEPTLIISAISAMMAAIGVWQKERDYRRTIEEFDRVYKSSLKSLDVLAEGKLIARLLPQSTLDLLGERVEQCWKRFDDEIRPSGPWRKNTKDAEVRLEQCICEELRTIKRLNGTIPPGKLREWWNHYGCGPYIP